ncbi:type II toxin-antitoxin system PemI/MazE family antitoxin [Ligilactobacillus salitolerans]|nr:hypothetical protein [Ligilactobacillus salitolerans]
MAVTARIQGNAVVITLPKSLNVEPGTKFDTINNPDGTIILKPIAEVPDTLEELLAGWNEKYATPADLEDWDDLH